MRTYHTQPPPATRGLIAENFVAYWLQSRGWTILARRMRTPVGEIDLIASTTDTTTFIEVKLRRTLEDALRAWLPPQQRKLLRSAEYALARHLNWNRDYTRFDLAAMDRSGRISYLENVLLNSE